MPSEPHPDHRATALLAWEAVRQTDFAVQPIAYEISVQGLVNCLVDITSFATRKAELMQLYTSQLSENAYIDRILGLNQARTWSLPMAVTHAEGFWIFERQDRSLLDIWHDEQAARLRPEGFAACDFLTDAEQIGAMQDTEMQLKALQDECAALRYAHQQMLASRSWRITAPLRALNVALSACARSLNRRLSPHKKA